jgi:hypothetical protein
MLIVSLNERKATRAAFAAERCRLSGGQHCVESRDNDALWCPNLEPSHWRGS